MLLKRDQNAPLADSLPATVEQLEFHVTKNDIPRDMATKVMGMFEAMIEDKATRGRLPNLQGFSVALHHGAELLKIDLQRRLDFERACAAAGVLCEGPDKEMVPLGPSEQSHPPTEISVPPTNFTHAPFS